VLAGGVLAVYLRQQNSAVPVTAAEGALMGLLAGVIGGVIGVVLSIPIQMMMGPLQQEWMTRIMAGNEDMPPEVREMMDRMVAGNAIRAVGAFINIITSTIFGMLGGLLGVAIFKRNAPPQPPTVIPHDPGFAQ
jgi:small basic protein